MPQMFKYAQKECPFQNKSADKEKCIYSKTNIPVQMKRQFEDLSGLSFDDVRVNYDSAKPTQLQVYKMPYNYNSSVVQLYSVPDRYKSANGYRYMQCEGSDTDFDDLPIEEQKNDLAILYEIIVYDKDAYKVIQSFENKFTPGTRRTDVALSLVVNHKVGDENINRNTLIPAEIENDPLINVERAIWGMRNDSEADIAGCHPDEEEIPYYSLRRRAAINHGSQQLEVLLRRNSDNVWRRMCDSDASFHDPRNPEDKQMDTMKIAALEEHPEFKMVTFGYILETPSDDYDNFFNNSGVQWLAQIPPEKKEEIKSKIKQKLNNFIDLIYQYEAEFRKDLKKNGLFLSPGHFLPHDFDYYPCEPSTYYRFDMNYDKSQYWIQYPNQHQQIAEGRTFKENYINDADKKHVFVSKADTLERTGAGRRHREFIYEFLKDKNIRSNLTSKQIKFSITREDLFDQIKKLSQSYFNPKTHGIDPDHSQFNKRVNKFLNKKHIYRELQKNKYVVKW